MALRRIKKELLNLDQDPVPGVSFFPRVFDSDLFNWTISVLGPEGTPYEDGVFFVNIALSCEYPFKVPKLKFVTQIYHPNITCEDLYYFEYVHEWVPRNTIRGILEGLLNLLKDPKPDDPLDAFIALEFKANPALFTATATSWTSRFAK